MASSRGQTLPYIDYYLFGLCQKIILPHYDFIVLCGTFALSLPNLFSFFMSSCIIGSSWYQLFVHRGFYSTIQSTYPIRSTSTTTVPSFLGRKHYATLGRLCTIVFIADIFTMKTTGKKVITRVLGLTYAPCMDTYTNNKLHSKGIACSVLREQTQIFFRYPRSVKTISTVGRCHHRSIVLSFIRIEEISKPLPMLLSSMEPIRVETQY